MIAIFRTEDNQQAMSLVINYLSANPEKERRLYVVSAAYRISKQFLEKIHKCLPFSKATNYLDNVKLQYHHNNVHAMPIGDGSKLRGLRGDMVFIEADVIPKDTLQSVLGAIPCEQQ